MNNQFSYRRPQCISQHLKWDHHLVGKTWIWAIGLWAHSHWRQYPWSCLLAWPHRSLEPSRCGPVFSLLLRSRCYIGDSQKEVKKFCLLNLSKITFFRSEGPFIEPQREDTLKDIPGSDTKSPSTPTRPAAKRTRATSLNRYLVGYYSLWFLYQNF